MTGLTARSTPIPVGALGVDPKGGGGISGIRAVALLHVTLAVR